MEVEVASGTVRPSLPRSVLIFIPIDLITLAIRYIGVDALIVGYIIGFQVVDDVSEGIKTLLYRIMHLMVHCADMVSRNAGRLQVGRAFETNCKAVKLRPPCILLISALKPSFLPYFIMMAAMTDESRPPLSSTP